MEKGREMRYRNATAVGRQEYIVARIRPVDIDVRALARLAVCSTMDGSVTASCHINARAKVQASPSSIDE